MICLRVSVHFKTQFYNELLFLINLKVILVSGPHRTGFPHEAYLACGVPKHVRHDGGSKCDCHSTFRISRNFITTHDKYKNMSLRAQRGNLVAIQSEYAWRRDCFVPRNDKGAMLSFPPSQFADFITQHDMKN